MAVDEWDEDTTASELEDVAPQAVITGRGRACLTVLSGNATGTIFKLSRGPNVIGRASDAALQILDDGVSRHHARIQNDGALVVLEDLGSRNGTYLNGQRITEPMRLSEGDKIQLGRATVMRFAYHDELDESFHEQLMSSALRDPLTKLFNKRYLLERLESELKFSRRHQTALSVLMLDIDHFKKINDTYGHLMGDAVLVQLAAALTKAVRNEDVVARFGGEEMAVVLRAIPLDVALTLAERLRKLVETTEVEHQGRTLAVTASVGVAGYPAINAETVEQLLEAADQALYRAKHAGRNRVSR